MGDLKKPEKRDRWCKNSLSGDKRINRKNLAYNKGLLAMDNYHNQKIKELEDEIVKKDKLISLIEKNRDINLESLESSLKEITQRSKVYSSCNQDLLTAVDNRENKIANLKSSLDEAKKKNEKSGHNNSQWQETN